MCAPCACVNVCVCGLSRWWNVNPCDRIILWGVPPCHLFNSVHCSSITALKCPPPQSCAHKVETKREKLCLLCYHIVFSLHYHRLLLLARPAHKNVWASERVQETGP